MRTLLLLGGTAEARALADRLDGTPGLAVVSSLAGRVARPALPVGETRTGGFGGVSGLIGWLAGHAPALVIDATHPFAAGITGNAVAACGESGTPLLRLQRPAWPVSPGWHTVASVAAAAEALPRLGCRPFLTTGRGGLEHFVSRPITALVRCVDPPAIALPPTWELILDRGPYRVEAEGSLLSRYGVDVLVTKNSGGELTRAKLIAAASSAVPVLMVGRPPAPADVEQVADVDAAVRWVGRQLSHPRVGG